MKSLSPESNITNRKRLPGEEGVWVFILGDISVFAIFFLIYAKYYREDKNNFVLSQMLLDDNLAAINTVVLLTSSLLVAMGLKAMKRGSVNLCKGFLLAGIACSLTFCAIKFIEYSEKVHHGYTLTYDLFFTFYYMLTGIHLLHVVIGTVILFLMMRMVGNRGVDEEMISRYESGGAYWHMVDLLWIVLFPLLYLVR